MTDFKASRTWLANWKKKFRIVRRRVTKVIAKKDASKEGQNQVQENIDKFRAEYKAKTIGQDPRYIFNTDQIEFTIEMLTKNTLEVKGTTKVISSIRQKKI